ncbi:hypothetical protein [Azospirillum sp. SYSU D00513]|uniref:hypothetical protein n=1 Tax=Azospirillum sp. SYSU D00513 TaxID=2812561 RepID=UPI001A9794BF|nr:hypothetical protein [Azospirillum sp. SYSU D00513]
MNTKTFLATAAFSAALLASGLSQAAEGFQAQLRETRAAVVNNASAITDRDDRESAVISLNTSEGYYRLGDEAKAQRFLNFARGELGLPVAAPVQASAVVAAPGAAAATVPGTVTGLRPEAH